MSVIERSWPMASGVSVSGNGTLSRIGNTGSASGNAEVTGASTGSPFEEGMWIDHQPSSIGTRRTVRSGRASGISTASMPSSYEARASPASTSAPSSTSRRNGPCSISICW